VKSMLASSGIPSSMIIGRAGQLARNIAP